MLNDETEDIMDQQILQDITDDVIDILSRGGKRIDALKLIHSYGIYPDDARALLNDIIDEMNSKGK